MKIFAQTLAGLALFATPALAHHGWSWTQDGQFQLTGNVVAVTYANPHPVIEVDVEGELWRVELAPLNATARAGFEENTAAAGDEITAIGNRSQEETELRMKAVRIIVGGETYDVYPSRAPTD